MKTKYQPKAGDVCEWTWNNTTIEVMICSPELDDLNSYIALDKTDLKNNWDFHWHCDINDLKLIYRP